MTDRCLPELGKVGGVFYSARQNSDNLSYTMFNTTCNYALVSGALVYLTFALLLALTDFRTGFLPDRLTLPLLWLGLLFHAQFQPERAGDAVYGAVAGYLTLWILYWCHFGLTRREGLGYGDMKFMAAVGAWNGWQSLPAVMACASVAGLVAVVALRGTRQKEVTQLAFGPCIALAGWGEFIWRV